jgi:uncharacterized protein involved in cysteine biosynthesis
LLGFSLVSPNGGYTPSVIPPMRKVSHGLHAALRGGGAVIEGIEFWGGHYSLVPRRIGHFLAAAVCTLLMTRLTAGIEAWLPSVPTLLLPWYLVAAEWAWLHLPSGLVAATVAWGAETAYLGLVSIRELVDTVVSRRGGASDWSVLVSPRRAALAWLIVGGLWCAGLAYIPVIGPLATLAVICPVLGGGFIVATIAARGLGPREILRFVRSRIAMLSGLGAGVLVALAIPVINLVVLPCAAAGAVCLVLREERAAAVKTSEGTVPYASPDKSRSPH